MRAWAKTEYQREGRISAATQGEFINTRHGYIAPIQRWSQFPIGNSYMCPVRDKQPGDDPSVASQTLVAKDWPARRSVPKPRHFLALHRMGIAFL